MIHINMSNVFLVSQLVLDIVFGASMWARPGHEHAAECPKSSEKNGRAVDSYRGYEDSTDLYCIFAFEFKGKKVSCASCASIRL